ncbi:MAG: J domain-containing protein [Clostridia bacterium]|nr:J domain-containing protein [Clostridia bacterium]
MILKNYYKILGLETSRVTIEEIKTAYRQEAKKYHPDLNVGDKQAEERIKDINEAYRTLSKPSSKRKYDRIWNSKFGKGQKAFTGSDKKGAIFNMFFGDVEENEKGNETMNRKPIKGENIETEIKVTIEDAFFGLNKQISLRTIDGKNRNITVTIPKGIRDGEKIRLIGQGKAGENGGKNGDLYIKIGIESNSKFKLKGCDLYTDLLLTPWEATLGARVTVSSIDDETKIYIPQGVQSGEIIKIPNKGYQGENNKRGDLIAEVKVVVPRQITEEEKEIYLKLNKISNFNPRN